MLVLFAALALAPAARADVINGSFESGPAMPPGAGLLLNAGDTRLTGWTIGGANVEYVDTLSWACADGVRSVGLNGISPGTLSQAFATVAGTQYSVTFLLSGEPFTDPILKHLRVSAAGQQQDFTFDTGSIWHWAMGWTSKSFSFTANATTTTLTFTTLDAGDAGPILDDVQVVSNVGVGDDADRLELAPVTPNPASGPAFVSFELPHAADVRLVIRDIQGREVARLIDGPRPAGTHRVQWDARAGTLPSGLYFISLTALDRTLTRRVSLVSGR
jgi:choice-of-anchor C domain-containing protein